MRLFRKFRLLGWLVMGCLAQGALARGDDPLVFISAFAAGEQGAIHAYRLDARNGSLTALRRNSGVSNPFYLAIAPDHRTLYSIHAEKFGGKEAEQIAAWKLVDRGGALQPLNRQSSRGSASCYLHVDALGRTIVVANYTSGSVASLPLRGDGSLGEPASFVQHIGSSVDPKRQKEPHAHSIVVSPNNRFVYAADLGLDQILIYRLDAAKATLTPHDPPYAKTPPGAGPRHLTFHPNGKLLYVINELSNSVTVFGLEAESGRLVERQTIATLPADFTKASYCADLKITPDGKFLYGTNRGHDSIASYSITDDGRLTLLRIEPSLGKGPQNLAITPDGNWLLCANMPGKNVAVFRIDRQSGQLTSAGTPLEVTSPSCIMIVP